MAKIEVTPIKDAYECDDCGTTFAEGYEVTIDGKPFGDYYPDPHCCKCLEYGFDTVMIDVLKHLGHDLQINPQEEAERLQGVSL
jgi:hypothetical protein